MRTSSFTIGRKSCLPAALALLASFAILAPAQTHNRVITLDPPTGWELRAHSLDSKGDPLPPAPDNLRRLGEAAMGTQADLHTLTFRFHQTARITGISVTPEFKIEQGGSCVEGNTYERDSTCSLLVRFTPQGPGKRLGRLSISHSNSATPAIFGLGGSALAPVISFIPSIIATVPGTYPSSKGLLSGAKNLAIDGSDTLYIADSGNNAIRGVDSTGTILTLASASGAPAVSGPYGVVVDSAGIVWFTENGANELGELVNTGNGLPWDLFFVSGTGTASCLPNSPCLMSSQKVSTPETMSIDNNDRILFADGPTAGTAIFTPYPSGYVYYIGASAGATGYALALDANDNVYWQDVDNSCSIDVAPLSQWISQAEGSGGVMPGRIVGGLSCGYSGDGGLGGNAEIGETIGQIVFDAAGNLYFSDTANQRVRRIDYNTGIIRTIAGNGTAGYTFDGYQSTLAELSSPTGVAVDSQGQVYIISSASSGQVIRKVGPNGFIYFGTQTKGLPSPTNYVTVTNTGNSTEVLTSFVKNGADPADFAVDPNTTTCNLANGTTLNSGQSCRVGVIFTPTAAGTRTANLVFLDNTVRGMDSINLYGGGTLPAPTFKITQPTSGMSYANPITFTATVTSASGPAPSGTVQFKVDSTNEGGPVTIVSGSASTSVSGLSAASHTFYATYSGDPNYAAAGPISVTTTVTSAIGTPVVTLSPAINAAGSCSTGFVVIVSSKSGPAPTGQVHLLDGTRDLASASLRNGEAVLTSPPLGFGMHTLTARYDGDANHQPAVSPALQEFISQTSRCGAPVAGNPVGAGVRVD